MRYPGAKDNVLRLSSIASKMQDYINDNTKSFEKTIDGAKIQIKDLMEKDILSSQLIINAVDYVSTRVDLEQAHIDGIFDLINKENGKQIDLPFDTVAIREYDSILITKKDLKPIVDREFKLGNITTGEWEISISKENNGGLRADLDKLSGCVITARKQGMMFKRFKGGTKSVGDYLTDVKAPKRIRDYLPVLSKDNEALVVSPYEISDKVAIDDNTKNIVYIKAERTK